MRRIFVRKWISSLIIRINTKRIEHNLFPAELFEFDEFRYSISPSGGAVRSEPGRRWSRSSSVVEMWEQGQGYGNRRRLWDRGTGKWTRWGHTRPLPFTNRSRPRVGTVHARVHTDVDKRVLISFNTQSYAYASSVNRPPWNMFLVFWRSFFQIDSCDLIGTNLIFFYFSPGHLPDPLSLVFAIRLSNIWMRLYALEGMLTFGANYFELIMSSPSFWSSIDSSQVWRYGNVEWQDIQRKRTPVSVATNFLPICDADLNHGDGYEHTLEHSTFSL